LAAVRELSDAASPIAVFCDFDGTFSVQDVGATLAQTHLAERRAALWERLARGELEPWTYNLALFEGFDLPPDALHAFLATIDLDPGAEALVAWCEAQGAPFRILSDGFDYNLQRLRERHGIAFEFDANHLYYRDGRWVMAPGYPDPSCGCGTGVCKRSRIREFSDKHRGVKTVHIGNGRVSDLCGARAADYAFAKDTLAEELSRQGDAFMPFSTLHDVVAALDTLV
jgi:2,3-diketo-5-methylthio-1-phosphopentane phosphatase